ncbi:MAG: lytic murein transglycosylase [Candidatus Adiutrix intracellularis]|jgi:membrane-bound lytic murein transglycosylase B|nr:lytic murein transglycosylase [Candidatus Adiutrix intracellularis]
MFKFQFYRGRLLLLVALIFILAGCVTRTVDRGGSSTTDASNIFTPWREVASKLVAKGFSTKQLESFFNSPNLIYSSAPMAVKLHELYNLYFHSELTREIQEKLFCLGYEISIDGLAGIETYSVLKNFQKDYGLTNASEISRETTIALDKVMKNKTFRPLSDYIPPFKKIFDSSTYIQFTKPEVLIQIASFYQTDRTIFDHMSHYYNVPGEVVAAIMWVETNYGRNFGKNKAAAMLASMAAAASNFSVVASAVADLGNDRETINFLKENSIKRGNWALNELAALLRYSFDNNYDPTTFPGSIYGAIGWGQFMPSNILKYGIDANGDGRIDLFDKADAIFSIGNFLRTNGWTGLKIPEETRRKVIMKYNCSNIYVNTIIYVADYLARQK